MSDANVLNAPHIFSDLRAKLELSIERLLDECCRTEVAGQEGEQQEDQDREFLVRSARVTALVRRELAIALRDLVHHGLGQVDIDIFIRLSKHKLIWLSAQEAAGRSLVPFSGCMGGRSGRAGAGILHAWDVVLKFYEMKGGAEFNAAPARRLSRSFGLDLAGTTVSNKQVNTADQTLGSTLNLECRPCYRPSDR